MHVVLKHNIQCTPEAVCSSKSSTLAKFERFMSISAIPRLIAFLEAEATFVCFAGPQNKMTRL
jgi:hypothetical protein